MSTPIYTDDPWLRVLAGQSPADSHQTRQAASLRQYFELQQQDTPALDAAAQIRVLNLLQAKGAFAASTKPVPGKNSSWLQKLAAWLFPTDAAHPGRWAAVAMAIVAVLVVPYALKSTEEADDPYGIKSLPPASAPLPGTPTAVIDSANPAAAAAALAQTLARHHVPVQQRFDGKDVWVTAQVPAQTLAAVQADLVNMGLAATPQGRVAVLYRLQP